MKIHRLRHQFVKNVPDEIEHGFVYVSIEHATVIHKCCCGCNEEVVTPLSPTDWQLTFDGVSVYLYPSIGNWSSPCQSHYWIKQNGVKWAERWSKEKIDACRQSEFAQREAYYAPIEWQVPSVNSGTPTPTSIPMTAKTCPWWKHLWARFFPN